MLFTVSIIFKINVAGSDYATVTFEQTFTPMDEASQMMCGLVQIIDDMLAYEPDEQFSVSLVSATPIGVFRSDESCITIMDNDGESLEHTDLSSI